MCVFLEIGPSNGGAVDAACIEAAEFAIRPWAGDERLCSLHDGRLSIHLCDLLEYQNDDVPESWLLDEMGSTVLGDALAAALPLIELPAVLTAMWEDEVTIREEHLTRRTSWRWFATGGWGTACA